MKPVMGTKVPGAVYLLNLNPLRDLPWALELEVPGDAREGRKVARVVGRLGLQVRACDHPPCTVAWVGPDGTAATRFDEPCAPDDDGGYRALPLLGYDCRDGTRLQPWGCVFCFCYTDLKL